MDATDIGAVANVDITLSSEDKSKNVDSVERFDFSLSFLIYNKCFQIEEKRYKHAQQLFKQ